MKIRIQGNTLRLRLKKSEVDIFANKGIISEIVNFGDNKLVYTLNISTEQSISSSFIDNEIVISIPRNLAKNWIETDLISLVNDITTPSLLIEKDFKCTSKDCKETEAEKKDSFPKPKK